MSMATFSGPIRVGTQRFGSAVNTGLPILTQSYTIPSTAILTAPAALTAFNLPAGSKILSIGAEVTVALATATNCGLTVGISGGSATQFMTSVNTGATVGKVAQAGLDTALQVANTNNIGTADIAVTLTPTAATGNATAGSIVVTITYVQRLPDGTTTPAATNV